MNVLRIFLFGKFEVRCAEQALTNLEARKVQELFSYLLLYRDRPHARETLADLLWGNCSTTQSKGYLRKALWQLQTALDTQPELGNRGVLLIESDWIQLNPEADFWLDTAVFEQTFTLVQGVPGKELDCQCAQTLQSAVDLYRGDLLEGWYPDWCLYERERLQYTYLAMLDKLMDYCESHHEYETGITYGRQALRYDRARERTHRRLMRLQYLAGDRTAALRQYECCVAALDEELAVKPAQGTVTLCEQIRGDQFGRPALVPTEAKLALEVLTTSLPQVLDRLKQLDEVLADVQRQVQQGIQAIELAVKSRR